MAVDLLNVSKLHLFKGSKMQKLAIHRMPDVVKSTMATWRKKRTSRKPSHTPGKLKRDNCQASGLDRIFASRNRSWKHPLYSVWKKAGK